MFKCEVCGREFKNKMALQGHSRVHKSNFKISIENQKEHSRKKLQKQIEEYNKNPKKCLVCGKSLSYRDFKRRNKGCSISCRTTLGNLGRTLSEETKEKISISLKKTFKPKVLKRQEERNKNPKVYICKRCGKTFVTKSLKKYCSDSCRLEALSKQRIKKILENGTSNKSTQLDFEYKGHFLKCDSKLEAAGLIYLIDELKASKIERFKSILSFKDKDNVNHRFNPDLFAIIDNKPYIIEIKQLWKNSITDNNYNKFFEEKKKAIKLFAEERNYNWIWLDFNYDKKFKQIYNRLLRHKNL